MARDSLPPTLHKPSIVASHTDVSQVAEPPCDAWGLAVNFEQQMRVLRAHRRPLPMSEFVQRLCLGTLPDRAVGITFDDGYIDNLLNAKSILRRYEIPATFFLVT